MAIETVDLPIKSDFHSYVSLPEGKHCDSPLWFTGRHLGWS